MESNISVNRIEKVREYVDDMLLHMTDTVERRCAYVHLYGVAQACAVIAQKRKENTELAVVAGMLHDISSYQTMDRRDHAHKSAAMAKELLEKLALFSDAEINLICDAIYRHSDKAERHPPFTEVLMDADVFQHCFYNPLIAPAEHEQKRFEALKREFDL